MLCTLGLSASKGIAPIFSFCTDPSSLDSFRWFACYFTTGKHMGLYWAFGMVLLLLFITAFTALAFGFAGAMAVRSRFLPLSLLGRAYVAIVRGIPDVVFFLFFVLALDMAFEWTRHQVLCPDWTEPIRQGVDFVVCPEAKLPLNTAPEWVHNSYAFFLAVLTFSIIYGAFASNVLVGAMQAVPRAQVETAEAYGLSRRQTFWRIIVPQMWVYALPGLTNLWMLLVKATPFLFLLGLKDIVAMSKELGSSALPRFTDYPHGDWRMWYFLMLLIFYICLTQISERVFERIMTRVSAGRGMAEMGP